MKIRQLIFGVIVLSLVTACSKSNDEEKKPLVNNENPGDMGKKLEGIEGIEGIEGYGEALDKAHKIVDTLQPDLGPNGEGPAQ